MSEQQIDRKRLYHVGNLSIFMIGLGFAVRANIAPNLQAEIYDKIDLANSAAMVGEALGITFTGFALTLLFGSALVDLIGMKRMLLLSALGYVAGSLGLLAAATMSSVLRTTTRRLGAIPCDGSPKVAGQGRVDHILGLIRFWFKRSLKMVTPFSISCWHHPAQHGPL